jgi:hypothetical protein
MNDQHNAGDVADDGPVEIPAAEKPRENIDPGLERLEESTLDKQARSAAYRDAHERKQHLDSLNRRIDVLQQKLDSRETEIREISPKYAALEQSMRGVNASLVIGPTIMALGGGAMGAPSVLGDDISPHVAGMLGGGGLVAIVAGFVIQLMAFYLKRPIKRLRK